MIVYLLDTVFTILGFVEKYVLRKYFNSFEQYNLCAVLVLVVEIY